MPDEEQITKQAEKQRMGVALYTQDEAVATLLTLA